MTISAASLFPRHARMWEYSSLFFLALTAVTLIGMQERTLGWLLWAIGLSLLFGASQRFTKHIALLYLTLAILNLTPINTDIGIAHMVEMGTALIAAVALPFFITRYGYRERIIRFPWHHGRNWCRKEVLYIVITAVIAYFGLPFYLEQSGAYANWSVEPGTGNIIRLFIGTNALGIWDELFFVSTVLAILREHITFRWANLIQATLFTSFLFELGFTGWGPLFIFPFALLQGLIFKRTESLLYIITIHLTLDLVLFLALIEAHHPKWLPIFVT